MAWIIYIIVTAISLFYLFRPSGPLGRHSGGFRNWKTWTALAGMALIVAPGAVTLLAAAFSPVPESPFQESGDLLVPRGDPAPLEEADSFLVRIIVTDHGNELFPRDFVQAVVSLSEPHSTELTDGTDLTVSVFHKREDDLGTIRVYLDCSLETAQYSEHGEASLDFTSPREIEPGYPAYQKIRLRSHAVGSSFGSLLADRYRPSLFRILCTPLSGKDQVGTVRASEWWESRQEQYRALVRQEPTQHEQWFNMNSHEFSFGGGAVSESGLFFLIGGLILILVTSAHWVRTFCCVVVYLVIYTAAMDSLVLEFHSGRLHEGSLESRSAAAVETAGSRMHAISAVEILLAAARSDMETESRCCVIRCLKSRPRLLDAFGKSGTAAKDLATLSRDEDREVSLAAREIVTILDRREQ